MIYTSIVHGNSRSAKIKKLKHYFNIIDKEALNSPNSSEC